MQFSNTTIRNISYGVLGLLAILIMFNSFNIKNNIINSVFGVKNINAFSNENNVFSSQPKTIREGFTFNTDTVDDDNVDQCINRKLNALKSELGGQKGISDIKKILKNAKEVCNYEASKCMMNILSANKNTKTINLENILGDKENKDCKRYDDYTKLSEQLNTLITNL